MFGRERRGLRGPPLWGKGPRWAFIRLFPGAALPRGQVRGSGSQPSGPPVPSGVGVQAAGNPVLSTPAGPGSGLGWGEEALLTPGAQPGRTWPPGVGEARAASLAVTERAL